MFKFLVLATLAVSAVHSYDASPAITSEHQNVLRSYGNLGQVSTFAKTLDTPFSSVRKSDVRISNPGVTIASPYTTGYIGHPGLPLAHHTAFPATTAYHTAAAPAFVGPAVYHHANAAVLPSAITTKTVVPAVHGPGLLGVAYSAAPTVSHMTYTNGLGLSYAW